VSESCMCINNAPGQLREGNLYTRRMKMHAAASWSAGCLNGQGQDSRRPACEPPRWMLYAVDIRFCSLSIIFSVGLRYPVTSMQLRSR